MFYFHFGESSQAKHFHVPNTSNCILSPQLFFFIPLHFSMYAEWNALYTTQLTQKAKKYHDGILQIAGSGQHMNQVSVHFVRKLYVKTLLEYIIYY